mmetsp:Transcript_2476/g.5303  ORF Transcript_2476/g.5303 Transcript_2476/m.5303 type:complete len:95 (+) Transcript_2476:233-517(+)
MATAAEGEADDAIEGEIDVAVLIEDGGLSDPGSDAPFHSLKKREVGNAMVEEERDGMLAIVTDCGGNEYPQASRSMNRQQEEHSRGDSAASRRA